MAAKWNFLRSVHADGALTVTDDHEGREGKAAAALTTFGHAADDDDALGYHCRATTVRRSLLRSRPRPRPGARRSRVKADLLGRRNLSRQVQPSDVPLLSRRLSAHSAQASRACSATAATWPWYFSRRRGRTRLPNAQRLGTPGDELADLCGAAPTLWPSTLFGGLLQGGGGAQGVGRWCRPRPEPPCGGWTGRPPAGTLGARDVLAHALVTDLRAMARGPPCPLGSSKPWSLTSLSDPGARSRRRHALALCRPA